MARTQEALRESNSGSSRSPWSNQARARAASKRTRSVSGSSPALNRSSMANRRRSSAGRYTRPFPRSSRTSRRMFVSCMATPRSSARVTASPGGAGWKIARHSRPIEPATRRQ